MHYVSIKLKLMNKKYLLPLAGIVMIGALSFQHSDNFKIEKYIHKSSGGSPTGKTGAPGEQTCVSCHAGTAQNGATENVFILLDGLSQTTTYMPSTTYTATLTMASSPAKKGFQAIALTSANANAGSFTGQAGNTAISSSGSKKYANHTSSSNTSTVSTWIWQWTAPSSNVGPVTFYVATNKANDNGTTSGGVIYLSQHVVTSTAGIEDETSNDWVFSAGYAPDNNSLVMNFNSLGIGEMSVNVVDLNGRSVFYNSLGNCSVGANKQSVVLPSDIKNGIYVVNFFVNNNAMSAKVMVQKN